MTIFGRTDLRINPSGAKSDEEADFDVRSAVGPPKPHQIDENLIFRSENFAEKKEMNGSSNHFGSSYYGSRIHGFMARKLSLVKQHDGKTLTFLSTDVDSRFTEMFFRRFGVRQAL